MLSSSVSNHHHGAHDFRRKYERKTYGAYIVFASNGRVFQGNLKDISIGGAFILSNHTQHLQKGAPVTISVPFTDGRKHVKRTGRVLWKDGSGFAISFYQ